MTDNPDILRILDANLNRCRETLRVIEDYARFILNDHDSAVAAKSLRHGLQQLVQLLGADELLAARDILNDVGQDAKLAEELERRGPVAVLRAAFSRLSEATRVLGEYSKLVSARAAAAAEHLRYRGYDLEQRFLLRGDARQRFHRVRLYVLLTEALCRRPWFETAEAAIRGGASCLQLREKGLPDGELLRRALQLRELTHAHNVLLAVNDRPDIAKLAGADIVHLGQTDLPVRLARRIAGPQMLVGKSTHTVEQLVVAAEEEPDYLAVGPMFPSGTKPQEHIAGPHLLSEARRRVTIPLVAIGGLTRRNVAVAWDAGASCVAVCSAVISTDDPAAAATELLTAGRLSHHYHPPVAAHLVEDSQTDNTDVGLP